SMKNSEEEEYTWDDVTSVSVNPTASTSSKRDPLFFFDFERPDLENNFQKTQRAQVLDYDHIWINICPEIFLSLRGRTRLYVK
ncbi:hypothetical protein Tco_1490043, partial [Tanacetum coccineum]